MIILSPDTISARMYSALVIISIVAAHKEESQVLCIGHPRDQRVVIRWRGIGQICAKSCAVNDNRSDA